MYIFFYSITNCESSQEFILHSALNMPHLKIIERFEVTKLALTLNHLCYLFIISL